jgi:hypothetical protein
MATDGSLPAPLPRRRRFQFSLKTLLPVTAVWAAILGVWRFIRDCDEPFATTEYHHVEYNSGTVHVFSNEGSDLGDRAIAHAIASVAHLGQVDGVKITFLDNIERKLPPGRLTVGAWDYVRPLNLRSFSIDWVESADIPQFGKLSSVEQLEICGTITSDEIAGLQRLLPKCKITVHQGCRWWK